jgi:GMP synthase (glutamine-hydrolysing)
MHQKLIILDFGSQYTQLIARRVRELNIYCEIHPWNKIPQLDSDVLGVILSGSPFSTLDELAPNPNLSEIKGKIPLLGVCYGAQLTAKSFGGLVEKSDKREYGRANLNLQLADVFLNDIPTISQVWMSHSDTIKQLPDGFSLLGTTESIPVAAFKSVENTASHPIYGLQFHPEVYHSTEGKKIISNFLIKYAIAHKAGLRRILLQKQ